MIDYTKIQRTSAASSNKVLLQGSGSVSVTALAAAGETTATATIPHGYNSDQLLFQVMVSGSTPGAVVNPTTLPWSSSDNRLIIYAALDSANLYIGVNSNDSSGFGAPARTIDYSYRLLVP